MRIKQNIQVRHLQDIRTGAKGRSYCFFCRVVPAIGQDKAGNLMVLGGNQGDQVNIKPFSTSRVVGYRWPAGFDLTGAPLETVQSDGKVSTNEA